jgi:hypothetical protein
VSEIMALPVGPNGDAYHIYPIRQGVREDPRPGREGRRGAQALDRRRERHQPVHRQEDRLPAVGPLAAARHRQERRPLRHLPHPRVPGRRGGPAVRRRAPKVVTEDTKALEKDAHAEDVPTHVQGTKFVAAFAPRSRVRIGDEVEVVVDTERMHFFDPDTGNAIRA